MVRSFSIAVDGRYTAELERFRGRLKVIAVRPQLAREVDLLDFRHSAELIEAAFVKHGAFSKSWKRAPKLRSRSRAEQRVDHRTFGDSAAATLRGHCREHVLELLQIRDLPLDVAHMIERQRLDLRTAMLVAVDHAKQPANFLEREPKFPTPTHKAQPLEELSPTEPVSTFRPRGRRQQADLLVIPYRSDVAAGPGGRLAPGQKLVACGCHVGHSVEPLTL